METRATGGGQQGTTSVEEGEREVQYPRIPSVVILNLWAITPLGGMLNNHFTGVT